MKVNYKEFWQWPTLLFYFIDEKTLAQREHVAIRPATVRTVLRSRLPNCYWVATAYRERMRKRGSKGREQWLVTTCLALPSYMLERVRNWLHTTEEEGGPWSTVFSDTCCINAVRQPGFKQKWRHWMQMYMDISHELGLSYFFFPSKL